MSTIFDHNGGKNVYHFYSVVAVVYQISSLPYLYDPRAPGNALPAEQRTLVYCTRYRFGTKFLPFDGIFIVEIFKRILAFDEIKASFDQITTRVGLWLDHLS